MTRPFVRAVVLNWNGGRHVLRAVEALSRTEWPADRFEVVVVDNASTDGSDSEIERRFPGVEVRRNRMNRGFPGNNAALGDLGGVDHVALVNNDAFVEPDWLVPLVDALESDPGLGAACPKLLLEPRFGALTVEAPPFRPSGGDPRELAVRISAVVVDGTDRFRDTWFGPGCHAAEDGPPGEPVFRWLAGRADLGVPAGGVVDEPALARLRLAAPQPVDVTVRAGDRAFTARIGPRATWVEVKVQGPTFDAIHNAGSLLLADGSGADRGFRQPDVGQFDEPTEVWGWCGGAALLRSAYLADVGLLWEPLFMYYEDTDLSWRGRARGWRYRYVPVAVVRHLHGTSAGEGSALFEHYVERNRLAVLTRNAPAGMAVGAFVRYVLSLGSLARRELHLAAAARRPPRIRRLRRRLWSLVAYLGLLPSLVVERRRLRRRQVVADDELLRWLQPRSSHVA